MVLQRREHILGRTTLCKLAVAVVTHHLDGTLHIGLVGHESLAEVVALAGSFQNFRLEEREGGVVPARTAAILVFDAGDGVLLDSCKDRLVGLFDGVSLFCCLGPNCHDGKQGECH